ncbi:nuclear transport factor 2 family protein [Yoonia sp. MH D7]
MTTDTIIAGQQLLLAFYQSLDEVRFADAAAAFASDGEWHRKGEVLTGPKQVEAAYDDRDPDLRTRHVISNVVLVKTEAGQDFSVYITLYSGTTPSGDVPTVPGPAMVLTSNGSLIQQDDRWQIQQKKTVRQFAISHPKS